MIITVFLGGGGGESEGLLIVDHSNWGLESPNCPVNTGCQLSILLACCNLSTSFDKLVNFIKL